MSAHARPSIPTATPAAPANSRLISSRPHPLSFDLIEGPRALGVNSPLYLFSSPISALDLIGYATGGLRTVSKLDEKAAHLSGRGMRLFVKCLRMSRRQRRECIQVGSAMQGARFAS